MFDELSEVLTPEKHWRGVTLDDLPMRLHGSLRVLVSCHQRWDPSSVFNGWSITQYADAPFIWNRPLIDVLLTDATWKLIRTGVVCILILSIADMGISVALAIAAI
jgi:hypothetical protein